MTAIAILCPGPSLLTTWAPCDIGLYDQVIAVNAATRLPHDWWLSHDREAFPMFAPLAETRVGVCTWLKVWEETRCFLPKGLLWRNSEQLPGITRSYFHNSGLAAIGLAVQLGATAVDLFGCDRAGSNDFISQDNSEGRTPVRWQDENEIYDVMRAEWSHVTFSRILP